MEVFFLFVVPDKNLAKFRKAVKKYIYVPFSIDFLGSQIIYNSKKD